MAKSKYKEKILEKMRMLEAEREVLADILRECKEEEDNGEDDTNNG